MIKVTGPLDDNSSIDTEIYITLPGNMVSKCENRLDVGWYLLKTNMTPDGNATPSMAWIPVDTCGSHYV